ncbi:MAG: VWA domain-containing protein, partial [Chloroflexota bacterium]|nr:VWA domain-containing protein [Chloroflexota bacterium]
MAPDSVADMVTSLDSQTAPLEFAQMILAAAFPLGFDFTEPLALGLLALLPLAGLVALAGSTTAVRRRRFAAIAIRCTLLAALIFALSGARLTRASDRIAVAFLVDASDSVAADNAQAAQGWVNGALTTMPAGDQAAIILFGANATVERAMSEERGTDLFRTQPLGTATDIAAAIRLGLALFPDGASRRMVIISDGEANSGDTEAAAMMAAANDVQISTVHLVRSETAETLVSDVRAPARARAGDTIDVEVRVESSQDTPATLRILADGAPLKEREVQLRTGVNTYSIAVTVGERGFRTFTASIVTPDDADTTFQNNELSAFTDVSGPARALILEGTSGEGAPLVAALEAGGLGVDLIPATSAPDDLPSYASYDVTLLVNVPAQTLGSRMVTLQRYVRDLGRGLVVIGGDSSYGVGGYFSTPLEETLPVRMEIRDPEKLPQVSVNFTIDKSGSMGKCHGDGSGNQARVESGLPKTDLAKEATYQAISMLGPSDEVGIVAFDDTAVWIAPSGPLSEQPDIASALASIQPEGGTSIYAGLAEAVDSMTASTGKVRHIILVTDGWSNTGNFDALLEQMAANDITLSVIGAGGGSATFLEELAERGGGRYYAVENPHDIPGIFLKETKIALRAYIVEGDIPLALGAPSPILDGISAVPNLRGYVSTTAKATAQTVLLSDRAEPLLAQWQYGLGRSVAWTSDAKNQWASGWVDWESFAPFWTNVARWAASAPGGDLQVSLDRQGDG